MQEQKKAYSVPDKCMITVDMILIIGQVKIKKKIVNSIMPCHALLRESNQVRY